LKLFLNLTHILTTKAIQPPINRPIKAAFTFLQKVEKKRNRRKNRRSGPDASTSYAERKP